MTLFEMVEWLGVVTALIYVYLASKGKKSCFIYGLISSILFVIICFKDKLYFDTLINVYYVVMSFVGWYSWQSSEDDIKVKSLKPKHFFALVSIAVLIALSLGVATSIYTDASLPFLDSTTTILAILATWLLVKKIIENWIVWIIADSISVALYAIKEHYPIALLFLVYTIIAAYGYYNWKSKLKLT